MKALKLATQLLFIAAFMLFVMKLTYSMGADDNTYYDDNGNKLPKVAVTALVRSQYVITTHKEDSLIHKHFK